MPSIVNDSTSLMHQLAKMAGMEQAGFTQMILVLDMNDVPRLYTAGLIRTEEDPASVKLVIPEGHAISHTGLEKPVVIDSTTMQNEEWKSKLHTPRGDHPSLVNQRCSQMVKRNRNDHGEQCCLNEGHEGGHKVSGGD